MEETGRNENFRWLKADDAPMRLSGFRFRSPGGDFRRFPVDENLPNAVNEQAWHTSGGQLAFISDTANIRIRVKLHHDTRWDHFTRIGSSGFDLYMGEPGKKLYFAGVTRLRRIDLEFELDLLNVAVRSRREFLLNFPLYSGVESFEIGIDQDAVLEAPTPWKYSRPVVVYGTSITHGGCASRPGMSYTNILSRELGMEFINLGFSNAGRGEPYVFEQLAKIEDPALFLLDYEANALLEGIKKTLKGGLDILRAAHPETPILVLSASRKNREFLITGDVDKRAPEMDECRKFQRAEVNRRCRAGDKNIYFCDGGKNFKDWTEFSVDGAHLTDLGFYMFAGMLKGQILKCLKY